MEMLGLWELGIFVTFVVGFVGFVFAKKSKPRPPLLNPPQPTTHVPVAQPIPSLISWKDRLGQGLSRSRGQLKNALSDLFVSGAAKQNREQMLESLFEILIQADVGVETSEWLVEQVKDRMSNQDIGNQSALEEHLKSAMLALLSEANQQLMTLENPAKPVHVVMMVGVNGVGKTTTTGKLAHKSAQAGHKVVIAAADTFRAAAVEQLAIWAERSGAKLWQMGDKADPASVAFEAVRSAKNDGYDICLIDTAGRLHNRNDLMQELAKIKRVTSKEIPDAPHEVLLVVDATTGQNAVMQAKVFKEIAGVTGVVLTKLDGTAKGGVALAILKELKLPIRYVGVGESVEDLMPFDGPEFVRSLLG